ncbi:PHD finger protein 21Aa isoform X1 [Osmerus eperlanus]|uniref:PHD finger protein 21Aa isoform X1 n=1 Tax=Osmerus eperlanus TaxID=29151 RepID=UPI002E109593
MVFKTEDCVKAERAPGLSSSQKGFMMELQDLQDALKMEIQVHQKLVAQMKQDPQNTELKKQLHELQTKITTLSDKQKKVVEQLRKDLLVKQDQSDLQTQTQLASQLQSQVQAQVQAQSQFPLQLEVQVQSQPQLLPQPQHPIQPGSRASGLPPLHTPPSLPSPDNLNLLQSTLPGSPIPSSKSLPLLLSAIPSPRPSVAMVTTLSHTPKPGATHPDSNSQNAPVSLQATCPLTNQGLEAVRLVTKSTVVVHTSQPIRVPQFVPPRLAPRPACQPQVRPRPAQPVLQAPPPMLAPPQLPPRPILLANQLTASSLPPSPTPIRQVRILNGQSCSSPAPGIIITPLATSPTHLSSSHSPASKTVKAKTGEIKSTSSKHPSPSPSPHSPTTRGTPPPRTPPRTKQEESPQKLAFMVSLGLVTYDHLEEIQSRRQERKRRTTANPVYSGAVFEPERKKNTLLYLNSPLHQPNRKRGRPPKHSSIVELSPHPPGCLPPPSPILHRPAPPLTPPLPGPGPGDADVHEDLCAVCRRSGQLLMCDTCSRVYHLDCLAPPLKTVPRGMWMCPSCQDQMLDKEDAMEWPGTLAIVHSYIAYKAAKEEEKQRQVQWARDLRQEREQLETRVKQLNIAITRCMESKNSVLSRQRSMQTSLEKVKGLLCLIKGLKPLSPPQTTLPPPEDPTNEGTGCVAVDLMEPTTEELGDTQDNDITENNDITESNSVTVNSNDVTKSNDDVTENNNDITENNNNITENNNNVTENNNDVTENNNDVPENKDTRSRSSPDEQRSPHQGAAAAAEEEEEEEEERKEEEKKEVEQKQEEVKLEEERSEVQHEKEAKQPDNNIVNNNKMNNLNSKATEINKKEGEEDKEETTERETEEEGQEMEDITKLGQEGGDKDEEVKENQKDARGEEEEEEGKENKREVRGEEEDEGKEEMTKEEMEQKEEAESLKENGNESNGKEDEEEKEERMEEGSVEDEQTERLSSLSKVPDPPLTLAPPPVGVTE